MFSVLNKLFFVNKTFGKIPQQLLVIKNTLATSVKTQKMDLCTNIVWMDLEMSGLDVFTNKILEISCLITDKDLNIIAEGPCCVINHPEDVFQQMNDWCKKHHYESGLVDKCLKSNITTGSCEQLILDFLKQHIPKGECPLGGNSVYMDRCFLRKYMPSVDEYMHYRIIDVSTIKELARRWNLKVATEAPKKRCIHRSLEDIYDSIAELKFYRQSFFKIPEEGSIL